MRHRARPFRSERFLSELGGSECAIMLVEREASRFRRRGKHAPDQTEKARALRAPAAVAKARPLARRPLVFFLPIAYSLAPRFLQGNASFLHHLRTWRPMRMLVAAACMAVKSLGGEKKGGRERLLRERRKKESEPKKRKKTRQPVDEKRSASFRPKEEVRLSLDASLFVVVVAPLPLSQKKTSCRLARLLAWQSSDYQSSHSFFVCSPSRTLGERCVREKERKEINQKRPSLFSFQ